VIAFLGSFSSYLLRVDQARESLFKVMRDKINHSEAAMVREMDDLKRLLSIVADYVSGGEESRGTIFAEGKSKTAYEKNMILLSEMLKDITQFRYIDETGMEIIRVERKRRDSEVTLINKEKLQNKSHRYYFKEAMKLEKGDVWISDLDLNIEFQLIEVPHKPVIRIAAPVFNNGERKGIVIVNYFADYFLDDFRSLDFVDIFLSDERGNYIFHPDPSKQFAKDRKIDANLFSDFPFILNIQDTEIHSLDNDMLAKKLELSKGRYFYLAYMINHDYLKHIHLQQIAISVVLYFLAGTFSFFFSLYLSRVSADQYDRKVMEVEQLKKDTSSMKTAIVSLKDSAYIDPLTGAFNRRYFDEKINKYLKKNTAFGLLLLDLDNFKEVNDKHGHDAGDRVLKDFTEIVHGNIRESDFLTRWGGDEFCLVIFDISKNVLLSIGEKLRMLTDSHDFGLDTEVTCSVGISYRRGTQNVQDVFEKADKALYDAKRNGRNIIVFKD